jgi:hypothetical protein
MTSTGQIRRLAVLPDGKTRHMRNSAVIAANEDVSTQDGNA